MSYITKPIKESGEGVYKQGFAARGVEMVAGCAALFFSSDWSDRTSQRDQLVIRVINIYYPPEVRRGEYWGLGVFLFQYFPLVKIICKDKKHLRGSTQNTRHPLAIILTAGL